MKQSQIKTLLFEIFILIFSITISFYIQDRLNDFDNEQLKNETLIGVQNDLKSDKVFF